MLHRNLDEPEPALEREVGRARVRRKTLGRAADDNADRVSRPTPEYRGTCALGDGADPLRKNQVAVNGKPEVGGEREEVRGQAGECAAESRCWMGKDVRREDVG